MQSKSCRGFTLVELLVVIAIILVLAALAFTGARSALNASKITDAQGTITNIYTAIELYKNENGKYPVEQADWLVSTGSAGDVLDALNPSDGSKALLAYDKEYLINDNLCDPWKQPFMYDLTGITETGASGTGHDDKSTFLSTNQSSFNNTVTSHIVKIFSYGPYNKTGSDKKKIIFQKER